MQAFDWRLVRAGNRADDAGTLGNKDAEENERKQSLSLRAATLHCVACVTSGLRVRHPAGGGRKG